MSEGGSSPSRKGGRQNFFAMRSNRRRDNISERAVDSPVASCKPKRRLLACKAQNQKPSERIASSGTRNSTDPSQGFDKLQGILNNAHGTSQEADQLDAIKTRCIPLRHKKKRISNSHENNGGNSQMSLASGGSLRVSS
mmetsp:Transcript_28768/g.38364  ORF Transcript_28768/g.38364 Transcript_28768/m.38364 type:complete len:139 (-) Transcript_28768:593-1009(-)